jgi:hypothetical protein
MSETRTVESDDSIALGRQVDEATRCEILDHAAISMQQYQRISCTALYVVEPNPVYFEKLARGRIVALGLLGESIITAAEAASTATTAAVAPAYGWDLIAASLEFQKDSERRVLIAGIRSFGCRASQARTQTATPDWRLRSRDKQRALGKPYRMDVISLRFAAILYISSPIGECKKSEHRPIRRDVYRRLAWSGQAAAFFCASARSIARSAGHL